MWKYNYTDELYHYGIPGMKWGKRKAQPITRELRSGTRRINAARTAMEARKKKYLADDRSDRAFDKAYKDTYNKLTKAGMRKGKATDKAIKTATKAAAGIDKQFRSEYKKDMKRLKKEFKRAKKEGKKDYKKDMKDAYRNVKKSSSLGEKLLFGKSVRKQAAKYVVDNKMTLDAAKKEANSKALKKTAAAIAAIGAVSLIERKLRQ